MSRIIDIRFLSGLRQETIDLLQLPDQQSLESKIILYLQNGWVLKDSILFDASAGSMHWIQTVVKYQVEEVKTPVVEKEEEKKEEEEDDGEDGAYGEGEGQEEEAEGEGEDEAPEYSPTTPTEPPEETHVHPPPSDIDMSVDDL